jgi:hypothetical protein
MHGDYSSLDRPSHCGENRSLERVSNSKANFEIMEDMRSHHNHNHPHQIQNQ